MPVTQTQAVPAPTPPAKDPALDPRIDDPILRIEDLSLWDGEKKALNEISLKIPDKKITAFIGPSGCGKSTLLRCINRLNDLIDGVRMEGDIRFEDVIVALNDVGYRGPLSVEWEDIRMDRVHGATEAATFVRKLDFPPSAVAFDAAFDKKNQ